MRQRYRRAPIHRRLLPWIFVLVFAIAAPALVLYTAGYRWNPKKQKIERNGTVIFDSTPAGASIWIDGRETQEKTPVTLQDMPPGLHRFHIERPGYHAWEKQLEVKAEHVTFANDVWLWKDSEPVSYLNEPASRLTTSPDERNTILFTDASPTVAVLVDQLLGGTNRVTFKEQLPQDLRLEWSSNSRNLLIESTQDHRAWLLDARNPSAPVDLPTAQYRWADGDLIGVTPTARYDYRISNASLERTTLPAGTADRFDSAELRHVTGTSDIVLVSDDRPDTGLLLPRGDWKFWGENKAQEIFHDGSRWMSLERQSASPSVHLATGDMLRPIIRNRQTIYLLVNGTEIWIWDPAQDPQLIYRQSETIRDAVWHEAGVNIFFATKNQVFGMSLDPRDGFALTLLATFDEISDLTYRNEELLVSGTKDAREGVWTVDLQ